jgi:glycosyltransferase involved in cell wall biosynthesis
MKIYYCNYHYDIEGIGAAPAIQIRSIAQALRGLGHQVDLQFLASKKIGPNNERHGLKKFRWARRYGHVPRLLLRNYRLLRREIQLMEAFKPDVVMAVNAFITISALVAARRLGIPTVYFTECPLEYEYYMCFPEYYRYPLLGRWMEGLWVRGANQVISVSETLRGYLMGYEVPAHKIHVIPNGVDPLAFAPISPDQSIIKRLQLQDRVVVGYVGSFEFLDLEKFVTFVKSLCDANSQVVFLFVGSGRFDEYFHHRIDELGIKERIIFVGRVKHDEVPHYLSIIDIGIGPYRGDYLFYNSPMKLLEYMAAGKPAVLPAQGQIKELIQDGYNGMLYEPNDYDALRAKLLRLIDDKALRLSLGTKARKTIEQHWTWDKQAGRILQVLELAQFSTP